MAMPPHSLSPEAMKKLREEYVQTFPEKFRIIEHLIKEMRETITEETLGALRLNVHKIAGSSGTYGFQEVSDLCKNFEKEILKKMEELKISKSNPLWASEFLLYFEGIKKEFSDAIK